MNELSATDWQRDVEAIRRALKERFSEFRCLRCGQDRFLFRVWSDESLVPALSEPGENNSVEIICNNCGFQERHLSRYLRSADVSARYSEDKHV